MAFLHRFWVRLAKTILRLAPAYPSPDYLPLDQLTLESGLNRAREEYEDEKTGGFLKLFEGYDQLAGQEILDLGCGFGGRTVAFQQTIQGHTTGLEVAPQILESARCFAQQQGVTDISFVAGFGENLPFENDRFDLILCYDVFEHVQNPHQCLSECWRVLKPGGKFLVVFPPYFHPTGAHLEGYVSHMPYVNLCFPASILIPAIDEILQERGDTFHPQPLRPGHILYSLNGLTIRKFRTMLAQSRFEVISLQFLPLFSQANRKYQAWKMKYYGWLFSWMSALPLIQEAFTHRVVAILRKK